MMEFHEKLQELRKQKGLTQEELAAALFVSRTAVSKWESGRGYPNIDSLKALSGFFGVTIDALLSGEELLTLAQEDSRKNTARVHNLVFSLLDCGGILFFFLPFFGQTLNGSVQAVSLLSLTEIAGYLKIVYFAFAAAMTVLGVLTLVLQNWQNAFWCKHKYQLSLGMNGIGVLLFILSPQPYAAAFLFLFLVIKGLLLRKQQ